jgi:hypothetical protein
MLFQGYYEVQYIEGRTNSRVPARAILILCTKVRSISSSFELRVSDLAQSQSQQSPAKPKLTMSHLIRRGHGRSDISPSVSSPRLPARLNTPSPSIIRDLNHPVSSRSRLKLAVLYGVGSSAVAHTGQLAIRDASSMDTGVPRYKPNSCRRYRSLAIVRLCWILARVPVSCSSCSSCPSCSSLLSLSLSLSISPSLSLPVSLVLLDIANHDPDPVYVASTPYKKRVRKI